MTIDIIALGLNAFVSILLPIIIFMIIIFKNKKKLSLFLLFLVGGSIYIAMQWGVKEHGLQWLFNNTDFSGFMNQHYIPYLLVVAIAGSILLFLPATLVFFFFKRKITYIQVVVFGLGYTMVESIMLMGYRSINTIIELIKGTDMELKSTTIELYLSCYERILMCLIQIAIFVVLAYFVNHAMTIRGEIISVFSHSLVAFLPGFLIAFSLDNYLEVYDRSVALLLVYIVLTAAAFTSIVLLSSLRHIISD